MIELLCLALILIFTIHMQSTYEVGLKLFLLWIVKLQGWIRKKSNNICRIVMTGVMVRWKWYFWEEGDERLRKKKNRRYTQKMWKRTEVAEWR
jgi:hypothetical protein